MLPLHPAYVSSVHNTPTNIVLYNAKTHLKFVFYYRVLQKHYYTQMDVDNIFNVCFYNVP